MQARSVVCVVQMIPNTREGRLCTGRSINGPDVKSATATATARTLNLSTMTAISTVSSQPSRQHSQPGRPSVAKIIQSAVAQLWAFNLVSATQCGAVARCVTSAYPGKSKLSTNLNLPNDLFVALVLSSILIKSEYDEATHSASFRSQTIPPPFCRKDA